MLIGPRLAPQNCYASGSATAHFSTVTIRRFLRKIFPCSMLSLRHFNPRPESPQCRTLADLAPHCRRPLAFRFPMRRLGRYLLVATYSEPLLWIFRWAHAVGSRIRGVDVFVPVFEDHLRCSDAFGKFSTITDSSSAYQDCVVIRSAPICSVLSIELSRFYHAKLAKFRFARHPPIENMYAALMF